MVRYKDRAHGDKNKEVLADLVLGADGPNSVVRKIFLKAGAGRQNGNIVGTWPGAVWCPKKK